VHTCGEIYDDKVVMLRYQLDYKISMSQKFVITQMLVEANWWLLWFIHFSNVYDTDAQIKSAILKLNTLGGNKNIVLSEVFSTLYC
jgi:hypothetical protein